jgi:hypothetical protein
MCQMCLSAGLERQCPTCGGYGLEDVMSASERETPREFAARLCRQCRSWFWWSGRNGFPGWCHAGWEASLEGAEAEEAQRAYEGHVLDPTGQWVPIEGH